MVLLSVIGLILFAQVWTDSAWVLCSPFLVWLGIGFVQGEESRKKTLNGAAHRIAGIAIPLTLVLIAYGIYQTNSAWPLAYLMAVIGGAGAGYDAATEEDTDWKTSEESEVAPRESAVFAATLFAAAGNANVAIWRERSDRWIRFKRPDTRNRCHFAAVAATAN